MNLLYILSEYLPDSGGGIITFYANLLPQLMDRGHRVKVLVANHTSMDRPGGVEDGVEVEYLQSSFAEQARAGCKKFRNDALWAFLPLAWGAFHQTKGGEGFDVVEATDWGLLFMPWVVSERKAKVVVSLHGSNGQVDWFSNPESRGFDGDVVRMAEVTALRMADAIHANSRANAEFWKPKLEREIRIIPPIYGGRNENAVSGKLEKLKSDLTTEDTENTEKQAGLSLGKPSRAAFSNPSTIELARYCENTSPTRSANDTVLAAESPRVDSVEQRAGANLPATSNTPSATARQVQKGLVVGRLQNWKGAEVLCQALKFTEDISIEWVGGDTPWGKSGVTASMYLKKQYPSAWGKKLHWKGPLPRAEVLKKISGCSFLVVPSLWDVFNLTVVEGMEAGVPVICSKAAGAEMLIEHGQSGLLFDPEKPEKLAECLNIVANSLVTERLQMGKMARKSVKNLLDQHRILNLLEESYDVAIKNDTHRRHDGWVASFFSPDWEPRKQSQRNCVQSIFRKIERFLADV